jgi:GntR family transcriptional regulator
MQPALLSTSAVQDWDCWDVLSIAIAVVHRFGFFFPPIDCSNSTATLFSLSGLCVYTVYMTMHSWITISLGDPRPLYLQVMEQIKRRVAVGDLAPGADLPSIRELAAGLQVSVITIKRAYLELERDGVIATRQGKGSVVADRPGLQASVQEGELRDHLKQVVSLGLLLGISKTEMQRRIADAYDQNQKGGK